ncbi:MAG: hypothetical protein ABW220_18020 [Burkholderiaceae bacterium]
MTNEELSGNAGPGGAAEADRRIASRAPAAWTGTDEAFVRCLSEFASTVLETVAARCDALQRYGANERDADFNQGVIAATRVVMDLASELAGTKRPATEWTAYKNASPAPDDVPGT